MRYNKLDLNLLVALDALLDESSVSRAADRLFITQSAMSSALARLRRHFQDELIVPVGRRMVLTEHAQALRPEVRSILMSIHQVTQPAVGFDPASARRVFKVAASDYFGSVVLPRLLADLGRQAPQVGLDVLPLSAKLFDDLQRGDVDLLIVPQLYAVKNYPLKVLFEDEWVCATWNRNSRLKGPLTLKKYLELEHVAKRENHPSFPPIDGWELARQKLEREVTVRVPQYGLLPLAVIGTDRIATVQRRLAEMYAGWGLPLDLHRCPFACPPLQETMQWHPVRESDAGHRWLREVVARVCVEAGTADGVRPARRAAARMSRARSSPLSLKSSSSRQSSSSKLG